MATQGTDKVAKHNVTNVPNLNLIGHRSLMENGNRNRSPMENGNRSPIVQNLNLISCSAAQPYNGHRSLMENGNRSLIVQNLNVENLNLISCSAAQPYNGNRNLSLMENGNRSLIVQNLNVHNLSLISCSAAQPHNGHRSLMENGNRLKVHRPDHEGNHAEPQTRLKVKERNDGKPPKSKEFEKQEKEREVTEYKAWLSENITKWTDSWPTYSERCTNSKLDRAEKKILFEKHVKGLCEQYLRDYRQLLKEVITPDLADDYLTLWSDAKRLLRGHQRFDRLPERKGETEWRNHAGQILKKKKEREVTEYRDWLSKNITKWTDSWTTYSERCTNSKLDRAEKKILFEEHVKGLREQYLRDYRQLLKEVITPDLADDYLELWSEAKRLLRGHQRFDRLPERKGETEWGIHVKPILQKRHKTK